MEFGFGAVAIGLLATFVIAFSKGAFGGGLAVVGIPLLTFVMSPVDAAFVLGPLLPAMDLATLRVYPPRTWSLPDVVWIVAGMLCGMGIGVLVFASVPETTLRGLIGAAVLLYALRQVLARPPQPGAPVAVSPPRAFGWGVVGGITTFVANAGNPPIAVYLLRRGLTKTVFAGTLSAVFTITNLARLPMLGFIAEGRLPLLGYAALLLPAIPAGVWAGKMLHDRLDRERLFTVVYALLAIAGAKLAAEGLGIGW
jgi:uncharacterized membrane protein YfcA